MTAPSAPASAPAPVAQAAAPAPSYPPSINQLVATTKSQIRIWKLLGSLDKTNMNTKMMLYCATGGRCALATKSLQDLGFTNATSVGMRFDDWVKAGNPVAMPNK